MRKILISISMVLCAYLFTACDPGEVYFTQWEGEYTTTETVEYVAPDGRIDTFEMPRPLPVYIFQDRGFLYVQTYGIGDPFIPDVDKEEHMLYVRSPKRLAKTNDSIEENDSIETIVLTDKYTLVMIDGRVYTVNNSHMISPKPIRVAKTSPDNLVLRKGSDFEIRATDSWGNMVDTVVCHWEYSPIRKANDSISWVAEVHVQSKNIPEQQKIFSIARHRFLLTKK